MKGSDFIAQFVTEQGSTHSFVLTGGACAHIIDSLARYPGHNVVCVEHEQAGAMAADGFSRNGEGRLGVAVATSGPGATNLITGIACAWFDSVPAVYITGQVNTFEQKGSLKIRQMGFQETEIVEMVSSITKFAKKVDRPEDLKKTLQEAFFLAREGRPGPVLIDVPFNVQTADIDFASTEDFVKPKSAVSSSLPIDFSWLEKLKAAQRPTLVLGYGVRAAGAQGLVENLLAALNIPVVVSWSGLDLVPANHPAYVGQIGVYGARAANFAVQNADFLLSIGSRLDSRQTGGKYQSFAREAYRVIVDVDRHELHKNRVEPHVAVTADARDFIEQLLKALSRNPLGAKHSEWSNKTQSWRSELPVYDKTRRETAVVNPYRFFDELSDKLESDAFLIADTGATLTWLIQGLRVKKGQRVTSAFGNSPMGYALPAAIGAWFAQKRPVYCIIGDGGFQINIQELQTLVHYQIPIRILILNNKGYGIIKQFQDLYLDGRHIATGEGYSCPDFSKIASAYGVKCISVKNDAEIASSLKNLESVSAPIVFDINVQPTEKLEPKLGWGRPIEDQLPLLDREQFKKYMLIEPLELSRSAGNEIN